MKGQPQILFPVTLCIVVKKLDHQIPPSYIIVWFLPLMTTTYDNIHEGKMVTIKGSHWKN